MGIYFDREARIVYLPFRPDADGATLKSQATRWGLIDYDRQGQACGMEIRDAGTILPPDLLDVLPEPPPAEPDPGG
ncbi:MAG: hypothetical protein JSS68_01825 [Actinobacteria bacterium]|nr:hypothetical protein [Actinomycetota bacterium]MBS1884735.1 hypothetical protein [Actinomycetota bacterium]